MSKSIQELASEQLERLRAVKAKLATEDDLDLALACAIRVEQEAKKIRSLRVARMDPPPLSGGEAAQFASDVLDLVYHVKWMSPKVREFIRRYHEEKR